MITEDYVSFEIAKLLKEKGFNEPCHATYDTAVTGGKPRFSEYEVLNFFPHGMRNTDDKYSMVLSAPTLQMTMKWLREKHRLHIDIDPSESDWNPTVITLEDWTCIVKYGDKIPVQDTYEEACEAAIKYCLENLI